MFNIFITMDLKHSYDQKKGRTTWALEKNLVERHIPNATGMNQWRVHVD